MRALKIEQVVIAIEPSEHRLIQEILALLEGTPARVSILPDLYQMLLGSVKVNHLFGTPLIEIKQDLLPLWQEVVKRVIDVVGSGLFLLLAWSVYAFTAVMVKLSSPGAGILPAGAHREKWAAVPHHQVPLDVRRCREAARP